jgi:hypothetical protein
MVDGYHPLIDQSHFQCVSFENEKLGGTTCLSKLVPFPGMGFFYFSKKQEKCLAAAPRGSRS